MMLCFSIVIVYQILAAFECAAGRAFAPLTAARAG